MTKEESDAMALRKFRKAFPTHTLFCNANPSSPVGGEACICPREYAEALKGYQDMASWTSR